MSALEAEDPEEEIEEVQRDSQIADEGARRAEQHWTENDISVATLMEKRSDGTYKLTVWELSKAVSHAKHRMSAAQRKLRRRVRCGVPANAEGKTLNQRINEGKSRGGLRAERPRPEGDEDEPMSEGEEWCLTEGEIRALSADRRAEYDAYCDRLRKEREEKDEEEFAEELGSGKFNWGCKLCNTVNPAWKSECAGSVRVEGSFRRQPCPGTQAMSFDGSEDPLLPPRASKSEGGKTIYTRYDIRDRIKHSGTRRAYERIQVYRELVTRDPEGADTGEGAVVIRRRGQKAKEHIVAHRRNARRNFADAKRAAVLADECRWPCLHCPRKAPETGMLLTVDEQTGEPVSMVESMWSEGRATKCWKCQRSKEELLRVYGSSYWECLRCENPHLALRQDEEICPNCKKPQETYADRTCSFKVRSIWVRSSGDSDSGWPTDSNASVTSGYSATSSTYSGAGAEILDKRHKRRGKGKAEAKAKAKAKVQERYTPRSECAGSNCPYNHRPRDVVPEDNEERSPKRRPLATSGAGAAKVVAAGLVVVAHVGTAEAVEMATVATGGGVALAAAVLLGAVTTVQRTTDAVGEMVDVTTRAGSALVNVTSEAACSVIEEVGKESKRFVPVMMGAIVVVVLVGLKLLVGYFWEREPKTEMLKAGRNPRSNDASAARREPSVPLRDRVDKVYGVPNMQCSDAGSFTKHVANQDRVIAMMRDEINAPGTWVQRCLDTSEYFTYKVWARDSATGGPREKQFYTLRINKSACMSKAETEEFRKVILCNCGGWKQLESDERDRLCLHCGLLMLICRHAWYQPLVGAGHRQLGGIPADQDRADRSSGSAPSRREPQLQIEDNWEVVSQAVRPTRINEGLIVRLPSDDEEPHREEKKPTRRGTRAEPQQSFGTRPDPSDSRAEKPRNPQEGRLNMGRKTNKIPLVREAVVDEGALEAMFRGYDPGADNAAELFFGGLGRILAIMPGKVTHKLALFMIGNSMSEIILTAFTFDLADLVDALNAACQRGVRVKVLVDKSHALSGTTQNMPNRLAALMDGGVEVRLCRGCSNGTGIQHSKTLMIDMFLFVGSANWTNASQSNQEVSILFAMNADGMDAHARRLEQIREASEPFSDAQVKAACEVRAQRKAGNAQNRSRSLGRSPARESTEDRFRTMRKFSIANRLKRGMTS